MITCSVVFVVLLNMVSVVLVLDGSPSHDRPYDEVNATKNELVTTPATFRNSRMLYHVPCEETKGNVAENSQVLK